MISSEKNLGEFANFIKIRLNEKSRTLSWLAGQSNVSLSYLSQLISGDKPSESISNEVMRRLAKNLDMPVVVCKILAGQLVPSDFFSSRTNFQILFESALETIARSARTVEAGVSSSDIRALPFKIQMLVIALFQDAEEVVLIPGRITKKQCVVASSCESAWVPYAKKEC